MSKDRKAKAKALGTVIGVSAAVATGVLVALSLTLIGPTNAQRDSVIYPADAPMSAHGMENMTEPPAP